MAQWRNRIKPTGTWLLSIPARMRLRNAGDEWAGHFRRYERDALLRLIGRAGFTVDHFECYGFPLTNLSERLSAATYRRRMQMQSEPRRDARREGTDRSGIDRTPHLRLFPI